jgi:hypothetical protein
MLNHCECAEAASQLMRLSLPKMLAPSGMLLSGIVSQMLQLTKGLQEGKHMKGTIRRFGGREG